MIERIETTRLTLVLGTFSMLQAEGESMAALGRELQADVAAPWPPPSNDEDSRRWMMRQIESQPEPGWGMWYFLLKRGSGERSIVVGNGGFKGPPTPEGKVEIGYSVVESHQRQGIATEAIGALVKHAFEDARVQRVIAETFPDNEASIRALEKNGFRQTGSGGEPGSIQLERIR